MRTLRLLLTAPPATGTTASWTLLDDHGHIAEAGRGTPSQWPAADRREAVLAAGTVRMLALSLPPLAPDRLDRAVAFALEERLATPVEAALVVPGAQGADGHVAALVVDRTLARAALALAPPFARIVAEPHLASLPPKDAWRWCASDEQGFVLTAEGEVFSVGTSVDGALPAELALALEQAARAGRAPQRVIASIAAAAHHADAWARATGVVFVPGPAWHWACGDGAQAPDLAPAFTRALATAAPVQPQRTSWRFAAIVLIGAGLLHLLATAGTWAWRKVDLVRTQTAIADLAREAGASDADDLTKRYAASRHLAGRTVPHDAWPRLAQAAPALAALPAGTLRSARYGGGAWTLELGPLDEAALAAFEARLRSARLSGVTARNPAGVRVRLEEL